MDLFGYRSQSLEATEVEPIFLARMLEFLSTDSEIWKLSLLMEFNES
jgi:hypothetical protein